ncbi:MAG: hypothetical protein HY868_04050 [Chloroflexi bacterium]|nr:hypothetical protein [Chloroflexota bacterium]
MPTAVYCVNHPQTETLLRCNKCGNPVCIKCVVRTPVGYRCKTCLNVQQSGYYTATALDYAIVVIVGLILAGIGGAIAMVLSGMWFLAIFYAPAAGGAMAEIIRRAIQKRRGKFIAWVAAGATVVGSVIGAGALPLYAALTSGRFVFALLAIPATLFNLGLIIYLVLAVSTVFARLRA